MSMLNNVVPGNNSVIQISEKDLAGREDLIERQIVRDAEELSICLIHDLLADEIEYAGIPTRVEYGTLKTGGLFNRDTEAVVFLTNAEHPHDYLRHLIRIRMTGTNVVEIKVYAYGISAMYAKRERMMNNPSILHQITGALKQVEIKAQEEEAYYSTLAMCIQQVYDKILIPD